MFVCVYMQLSVYRLLIFCIWYIIGLIFTVYLLLTFRSYNYSHDIDFNITGWTQLSLAARSKGININPQKMDSGRHETNLRKMDIDIKTLTSKGFHPNVTATPVSFSALLTYLEGLAPKFEDLKVTSQSFSYSIVCVSKCCSLFTLFPCKIRSLRPFQVEGIRGQTRGTLVEGGISWVFTISYSFPFKPATMPVVPAYLTIFSRVEGTGESLYYSLIP